MSPSEFIALLPTVNKGDTLTIRYDGGERFVTVTEVDGDRIYTTSGKVRPGRISGGYLRVFGDVVYFQPTMQQQIRRVDHILRGQVLAFGLAA